MERLELNKEYPPPDEQKHIDSLIRQLRGKMAKDYANNRTLRDAHPKMHGCVRGEFTVAPDLAADLRVGIFIESRTYPVWIRFSNQNNTVAPDSRPDIRGAALKLMGVEGQVLLPSQPQAFTHDFILINDNRFVTKDVAQFDALVAALIGGIPKMLWFFLTNLRAARNLLFSLKRARNPLEIRYFSVAPYLFGKRAVKYSLTPRDMNGTVAPSRRSADFLKDAMVEQLKSRAVVFDFSVQFQQDPQSMPIEDPGVTWDEAASPFRKCATLTIPPQLFDTPERREFGDNLSFNPWRCLPEHRPLGGISRARLQVYQALSKFRHERNQSPAAEPSAGDESK